MKQSLTGNLSYKFVALGVAVVLWMSMLGRKDSTLTRDYELQVLLGPGIEMSNSPPPIVRVEVSGPRVALKKLNQMNPVFTVDLSAAKAGRHVVRLTQDGLSLPIGGRVIAIEPKEFVLMLKDSGESR